MYALVELDDIDDLLPTSRQDKASDRVKLRFADLDTITKALQLDSATIADSRAYFDEVIAEYPASSSKLGTAAKIVLQPSLSLQ